MSLCGILPQCFLEQEASKLFLFPTEIARVRDLCLLGFVFAKVLCIFLWLIRFWRFEIICLFIHCKYFQFALRGKWRRGRERKKSLLKSLISQIVSRPGPGWSWESGTWFECAATQYLSHSLLPARVEPRMKPDTWIWDAHIPSGIISHWVSCTSKFFSGIYVMTVWGLFLYRITCQNHNELLFPTVSNFLPSRFVWEERMEMYGYWTYLKY